MLAPFLTTATPEAPGVLPTPSANTTVHNSTLSDKANIFSYYKFVSLSIRRHQPYLCCIASINKRLIIATTTNLLKLLANERSPKKDSEKINQF